MFTQAQNASAQTIPAECYHRFGGWQQVSPAPAFHIEGATTVIDGKIYVFSGFADNALNPSNRTDVYDIATDTWETALIPRAPTPFASSHIQAGTDGQFVWIVGGFLGPNPGVPTDETWRYDTVNDVWQAGPPLPAPRASGAVVRHGRTLHYIGGLTTDRNIDQPDHWTLDLDDPLATWQVAPPMPQPRNHMQAVAIGDTIFLVGGQFRHDTNPQDVNLLTAFNVVTGTWETRSTLPAERSHFEPATFTVNGRIMGFGGRNNQNGQASLNTAVEYDPQSDTWRIIGTLPATLIGPVGNAYNGFAVLTNGGFDYNIGQQNTWVTELIVNCPQQNLASPARLIQLDMTKTGAVESGGFGAVGETVTWTVTITNNGNSIENITVSDVIEPSLELISVDFDRNRGDVAIEGQNIRLFVPNVNPGDTISFNIQTRILARSLDGAIRNTVTMENTGESVTAIARVLPSVTTLPATGETPFYRNGFILILGLIGTLALSSIIRWKSL
ncbi:MAG: kelch repeat-containing protein [Aggregatilineales bacterium]